MQTTQSSLNLVCFWNLLHCATNSMENASLSIRWILPTLPSYLSVKSCWTSDFQMNWTIFGLGSVCKVSIIDGDMTPYADLSPSFFVFKFLRTPVYNPKYPGTNRVYQNQFFILQWTSFLITKVTFLGCILVKIAINNVYLHMFRT